MEPALNFSEPTELSGGDLHPKPQMGQNVQNMGKFLGMPLGSGLVVWHPNWSLLTKNSMLGLIKMAQNVQDRGF